MITYKFVIGSVRSLCTLMSAYLRYSLHPASNVIRNTFLTDYNNLLPQKA